jgi:uncharacterized protein (TIGR00266 family)
MHHLIRHGPSFALLEVALKPGETLVAEAGSMVARSSAVNMEVKLNTGRAAGLGSKLKALLVAFIRKVVGGETFFVNHFTAGGGGTVWLAPQLSGQVTHRRLSGETLVVSTGAFLASAGDVDLRLRFGGLRSLLAREGLFFLELSGQGEVWFTSYGGVHEERVDGSFVVDNGHIVGFEGQLTYELRSPGGGLMGMFASGEGLVCEFKGQGRVYLQSRNVSTLVSWVTPFLPS